MESGSTQRTIEPKVPGSDNQVEEDDESQMIPPELDEEDDEGSSGSEYDELASEKNARHNSDSDAGLVYRGGRVLNTRKRRATRGFTDEDKSIVAQAIQDVEDIDEPEGMTALWKTLAELHPHHNAQAWKKCYESITDNPKSKQNKAPFTHEDEEALIEFVADGGPRDGLSWKEFATDNPKRRVEAWQMYLYRNRNRLAGRIEDRRRAIAEANEGAGGNSQASRGRSSRGRRSHYSDMDRKILEDAIATLPHPSEREARTLTQLWGQLAADHPERSGTSWRKLYLKLREEIDPEAASKVSPRRTYGRDGASFYSPQEEDDLIRFAAEQLETNVSWAYFSKTHPSRTMEAWRQHWYINRERLTNRAKELGIFFPPTTMRKKENAASSRSSGGLPKAYVVPPTLRAVSGAGEYSGGGNAEASGSGSGGAGVPGSSSPSPYALNAYRPSAGGSSAGAALPPPSASYASMTRNTFHHEDSDEGEMRLVQGGMLPPLPHTPVATTSYATAGRHIDPRLAVGRGGLLGPPIPVGHASAGTVPQAYGHPQDLAAYGAIAAAQVQAQAQAQAQAQGAVPGAVPAPAYMIDHPGSGWYVPTATAAVPPSVAGTGAGDNVAAPAIADGSAGAVPANPATDIATPDVTHSANAQAHAQTPMVEGADGTVNDDVEMEVATQADSSNNTNNSKRRSMRGKSTTSARTSPSEIGVGDAIANVQESNGGGSGLTIKKRKRGVGVPAGEGGESEVEVENNVGGANKRVASASSSSPFVTIPKEPIAAGAAAVAASSSEAAGNDNGVGKNGVDVTGVTSEKGSSPSASVEAHASQTAGGDFGGVDIDVLGMDAAKALVGLNSQSSQQQQPSPAAGGVNGATTETSTSQG